MNWKEFTVHKQKYWITNPFTQNTTVRYIVDKADWSLRYEITGEVKYAYGTIGSFDPEIYLPGTPEAEEQAMQCLRDLVNTMQDELSSNA